MLIKALANSHPDHEVRLQSYYEKKRGIESLGTFHIITLGKYYSSEKKVRLVPYQ
jgi:hypothetical protein